MNIPLHNGHKKEFQLERLILFSDAVFAIAITLLAIDLKVPDFQNTGITEANLAQSLLHLIPKFFGFLLSFFLIGQYWSVHHRLFGFVTNYNQRLLWINLIFLLSIVLMPFTTSFYSEYIQYLLITPMVLYLCNVIFVGLMSYCLWKYVGNPKNKLTVGLHRAVVSYFSFRSIMTPLIFTVALAIYLFAPIYGAFMLPLTPMIVSILSRLYKKKLNPALKQHTS